MHVADDVSDDKDVVVDDIGCGMQDASSCATAAYTAILFIDCCTYFCFVNLRENKKEET